MSDLNLTKKEYLTVLKRMRKKIADSSEEIIGFDDTSPGCHHTECTAGLCLDDPKVYTKEMNLFPELYPARVSPKYRKDECCCPLSGKGVSSGCFYTCLFFKHHVVDKARILELYDDRIKEVERQANERWVKVKVSIEAFGEAVVEVVKEKWGIKTVANGMGFQTWSVLDQKTGKLTTNGDDITTNYLEVASEVALRYLGYHVKVEKTRPCERKIEVV